MDPARLYLGVVAAIGMGLVSAVDHRGLGDHHVRDGDDLALYRFCCRGQTAENDRLRSGGTVCNYATCGTAFGFLFRVVKRVGLRIDFGGLLPRRNGIERDLLLGACKCSLECVVDHEFHLSRRGDDSLADEIIGRAVDAGRCLGALPIDAASSLDSTIVGLAAECLDR